MSKKVHFWLYKGDVRVTGLYGLFYQFTDEPKEYTYSKEQVKIVLGNLENKIERLAAEAKEPFCKGIVQRGELTHSEALSLAGNQRAWNPTFDRSQMSSMKVILEKNFKKAGKEIKKLK